jgi:hypothetical protein
MTPLQSIRAKCVDCCAGSRVEIARCPVVTCALHPFRMGHNPNRQGLGNPDSLLSAGNRLRKVGNRPVSRQFVDDLREDEEWDASRHPTPPASDHMMHPTPPASDQETTPSGMTPSAAHLHTPNEAEDQEDTEGSEEPS